MTKGVKGFRLDSEVVELLDGLSKQLQVSQTEIVAEGIRVLAAAHYEAFKRQHDDLDLIRRTYDGAQQLMAAVFEEEGEPVGRVVIDGQPVDDVLVHPYVDAEAGVAHLYLSVPRSHVDLPIVARIGKQALFLPHPRFALGELPWPAKKNYGIFIDLRDLDALLDEQKQALAEAEEKAREVTVS